MARVLHVIETLGPGGAERLLYLTLRELRRGQFESVVCYLRGRQEWREPIEALGIPVEGLALGSALEGFRAVRGLRALVRRWRVDLVHSHLYFPNLYAQIAGRMEGVPVVSSLHNLEWEPETLRDNPRLTPIKQRALLLGARAGVRTGRPSLVAVSEAVQASSARRLRVPRDAITVIRNGIDLADFDQANARAGLEVRRRLGIGPTDPLVLAIGRHVGVKGYGYLIDAIARVRTQLSGTRLVLVGEGPLTSGLMAQAEGLGLGATVHLVPTAVDVRPFVLASDVVAVPSLTEGFGMVALETMALGRPCVASSAGGLPEIVEDGRTGLLVPPGDVQALAEALLRLLADTDLRRNLGEEGRRAVRGRFDIRATVGRLEEHYAATLAAFGKERVQPCPFLALER
jgi:glycosyltransferase involved in cell wall biosynthesis